MQCIIGFSINLCKAKEKGNFYQRKSVESKILSTETNLPDIQIQKRSFKTDDRSTKQSYSVKKQKQSMRVIINW